MDPFSAVSLAGTVVQLLDFGIKLVAKSHELYTSATGTEVQNIELDAIAQNLTSLNQRVQNRARNTCAFAVSEDEKALADMTSRCTRIGQELIDALQRTKVQGSHRAWKSVRQALKSTLSRGQIENLYDRLKQYREQIVVVLLVITSAKQTELGESVQNVRQDIVESESRIVEDSRRARFQILNAIRQSNYQPDKPQDVATVSRLFSDMVERASGKKKTEAFLNSLYYPRMKERREWISKAHRETFSWALESSPQGTSWSDLQWWLKRGEGMYWLSGKAGSGKSTLIKYIDYDARTVKYLGQWASPLPLIVASFYFWSPGTSMQKSQLGLLQSLLFEILDKRPDLISTVFPARWQSTLDPRNTAFTWSSSELSQALKVLAETELKTKFCFIIDGLDEFDGDHQNLADMLFQMTRTPNVKILVSSRPWIVFKDAFEHCPKLVLQDLTHGDIKVFAHESLYKHPRFDRLLSLEPDRAPGLVTEIVDKASGVFLWVYLVVRSLMDGLSNADRISDLQRRLQELPADLEHYFLHILASLDAFYLHQASQLFRLALESRKPLSVLTFSYLDEEDPDFALKKKINPISEEEEAARCETIERRLNSRCKGLLESRYRQGCDSYSNADGVVAERNFYEVDFLHRTVRDFLTTPTIGVELVASDTAEFNAKMTLARAFVAQIKGLRRASHSETNFQILWEMVFDVLRHLRHVGDAVSPEKQEALLDEMDRGAADFRAVAIVKRRCDPMAHWTNTGYRFGLDPKWNNDLLTLCVQVNLMPYVRQKLTKGLPLNRSGRPLLAFAMTAIASVSNDFTTCEQRLFDSGGLSYNMVHVPMVTYLLEKGADPNDLDQGNSIWSRYLVSMHTLASKDDSQFSVKTSDWFEVTKLLLEHGADSQAKCTIRVPHSKPADSNLKRFQPSAQRTYSAIDIVRLVFGGVRGYDVTELEDLIEQQRPRTSTDELNVTSPYLQVPGNELQQSWTPHKRTISGSSLNSQASAQSWRRPTDQDVVVHFETLTIQSKDQSTVETIASPPMKSLEAKKRLPRLLKWIRKK